MAHNNKNNNNKNKKHNNSPRYIPLPKSLWELRHRFPTVTRCVMLQCVRCHRWVAQPVTHSIPDVVQTCPTPATTTTTTHKEEKTQHQHEEQEKHESQHVKEESKDEWRSPRLRQHYEKVVDAFKSTRQQHHNEPQTKLPYFIPNPANFKCQWVYCDLCDVWADMREQWLGELYVAMVGAKNDEENSVGGVSSNGNNNSSGSNKGIRQRGSPHSQQERLNEELTKELHGRRSERLAKRPHNGIDIKYENSDGHDNVAEPSHSGRIAQHVNNLIHQDEAVLASFCWISCDRCGKLRRVHQPFPGGAPFVCELALNITSCAVPENEGLSSVFCGDSARSSMDDKMENNSLGDLALRDSVETEASVALTAATTGRRASKVATIGKRQSRRGSFSLESTLPLLRQLTTALRKRALGAFVKNLMIIPQEVRAKREEVVRSSLLIAEGGSRTDSNSPKRNSGGSIQGGVQHNKGGGSSSTPTHTPIKQEEKQEEQEVAEAEEKEERENEQQQQHLQKEEHYRNSKGGKKQTSEAFQTESPRPTRRLGCPPRHAKWELREDVNSHRISLVVNPSTESLDGVDHHKEISPLLLTQHQQGVKEEKHFNKTVSTETILKSTGVGDVTSNGNNKQMRNLMDKEEKMKRPSITVAPPAEMGLEKMSSIREEHHTGSSRGIVDRKRKKQTLLDDYYNSNHESVSQNSPRGSVPLDKDYNNTNEKKKKVKKEAKKQLQEDDVEIIHWVCCDVCNKWRIVPKKIPEGTEEWQCVMRGDGTNCSDTDDEIRMNRSEKERKTRGRPRKVR
ncbi:zinc finger protein [Trypanosoma melophagium]|uniref:zinc finger protein n=1 Tax=Trypanosoma melophagium TaxID=715481 RepID=UPI00351A044E|nr:zinc finger protein [Trypanosoma melophagium]